MKSKKVVLVLVFLLVICTSIFGVFAHSGRTDANGGHRDNENQSGLGSYHYHCGGYPAHLHSGGVCPYKTPTRSYTSTSSSYDDGYDEGYADGYLDGYDKGADYGEGIGYEAGHNIGYDKGYDEGYDEGYDRASTYAGVVIGMLAIILACCWFHKNRPK